MWKTFEKNWRLLLQSRCRNFCVYQQILIITVEKVRLLTWDVHNYQFVAKEFYISISLIHYNKLTSKSTSLAWSLLLQHPVDWGTVDEYQKFSTRATSQIFDSMFAVDVNPHCEPHTTMIRIIRRNLLIQITIVTMGPIFMLELQTINIWISHIENYLCILVLLQISKDMEKLDKMNIPWKQY